MLNCNTAGFQKDPWYSGIQQFWLPIAQCGIHAFLFEVDRAPCQTRHLANGWQVPVISRFCLFLGPRHCIDCQHVCGVLEQRFDLRWGSRSGKIGDCFGYSPVPVRGSSTDSATLHWHGWGCAAENTARCVSSTLRALPPPLAPLWDPLGTWWARRFGRRCCTCFSSGAPGCMLGKERVLSSCCLTDSCSTMHTRHHQGDSRCPPAEQLFCGFSLYSSCKLVTVTLVAGWILRMEMVRVDLNPSKTKSRRC